MTTQETADYSQIWLVESNAGLHPFSRDKLFLSIYRSLQHRPKSQQDASAITQTVVNKLMNHKTTAPISARTIINTTQVALNRFDAAASVHYQAFHRS